MITYAAIGDSLTEGSVSYPWLKSLESILDKKYKVLNFGKNSYTTENYIKELLFSVIDAKPNFITLLLGLNDVNGSIRYPNSPNFKPPQFQKNLNFIIKTLKEKTSAKIAIMSLPPIGEDINSLAFKQSQKYNQIIANIAKQQAIYYLPVSEILLHNLLYASPNRPKSKFTYKHWVLSMVNSIARHLFFKQDYKKISQDAGMLEHADLLHLNQSAEYIAGLVYGFLLSQN